jgi:hypothetical protein
VSTDGAGVTVTLAGVVAGDYLTRRSAYGVERVPLPASSGAMTVTDYAAPLNVPLTYVVNKAGADEQAAPITLPSDVSLLQVAAYPPQRTTVVIEDDAELTWENLGTAHKVIGRRAPLAVAGALHFRAGDLRLYVETDSEYANLRDVLDTGDVLRLRPACATIHPATMFVSRVRVEWVKDPGGPRRVTLTYQAVAEAPYVFVGDPTWTWAQVPGAAPTWTDVDDNVAPTWRGVAEYSPSAPKVPPAPGSMGW